MVNTNYEHEKNWWDAKAKKEVFDLLKSNGVFAMFMKRADIQPGGGYTDEPLRKVIRIDKT